MNELQKGIVDKYNADVWLAANTLGLYFEQAPDSISFPYGVFYLSANYDHVSAGICARNYRLLFNLYSKTSSSQEINQFTEYVVNAFNNTSLSVVGHTLIKSPRIQTSTIFQVLDDGRDVWQSTLIFNMSLV